MFRVATLRKEYYVRCRSVAERDAWVKAIRTAKQHAIKVRMGHVPLDNSTGEKDAWDAGKALFNDGLEKEIREAKNSENVHMQMLGASGFGSGMASSNRF